MDFLKEWITNIILFVLLATVIDLLLPNSNMQKYTKMVTGLLLIAIILSPVLKLISSDFETMLANLPAMTTNQDKQIENSIELQKKEIQASQRAYILEETAVQLKESAKEELMNQYGVEIANIKILVADDFNSNIPGELQTVTVELKDIEKESEAIEAVKKVEIDTGKPPSANNDRTNESQEIASLLSEKWDIDKEIIEIVVEGGDI